MVKVHILFGGTLEFAYRHNQLVSFLCLRNVLIIWFSVNLLRIGNTFFIGSDTILSLCHAITRSRAQKQFTACSNDRLYSLSRVHESTELWSVCRDTCTPWAIKMWHFTFVHIFTSYWPIF